MTAKDFVWLILDSILHNHIWAKTISTGLEMDPGTAIFFQNWELPILHMPDQLFVCRGRLSPQSQN